LSNRRHVNNWDLVDSSASYIVGKYLFDNPNLDTVFNGSPFKGTEILEHLSKSQDLWERRISMIAAGEFIKHDKIEVTLKIAKQLLSDKHDLIHKAVGWMLREVGKRDQKALEKFLKENYSELPRTTLRYAIEKFPPNLKMRYLRKYFD
jgi:3-methyladenine DNA glycosylase AlkD